MTAGPSSQAVNVLGLLADLSPSAQQRAAGLAVPTDWFRWLPASGVALFRPTAPALRESLIIDRQGSDVTPRAFLDRGIGERLAAVDRIRPGAKHSLRAGWLFVAGRRPLGGGRMQRVLHPLVSVPVRIVVPLMGRAQVWAAGDVLVSDLIADDLRRHDLEAGYELGGGALDDLAAVEIPKDLLRRLDRLHRFAMAAAEAAGFEVTGLVPASCGPENLLEADRLTVVAGVAVYATTEVGGLSAADGLRSWAARPLPAATAFSAMYLDGAPEARAHDGDSRVVAPFPLTSRQREAVSISRAAPVSVISGAAGTGKSHAVSAIACDAVGRGESVLVAAKSEAAVDALLVLLGEATGPEPIVFGSSERRNELARRLASGEVAPVSDGEIRAAAEALDAAVAARDELVRSISERLLVEAEVQRDPAAVDAVRRAAPELFDPGCDLGEVRHLLDLAGDRSGWMARRRARKAQKRLTSLTGVRPEGLSELAASVQVADRARLAGDLVASGGLDLAPAWARLEELEAELCRLEGTWLALSTRSPKRLNRSSLQAIAMLATALRSGRAARRTQLARLDGRIVRALPLWVGTLGDIEDLLPPVPALFDLLILDEASAIDQPLAVPALLRARRTVIVGDPHQLRHVSFLGDEPLERAIREHGLDGDPVLAARLDVRRNSVFDVAVGVAPATVLDEHFRCAPHLVDFVARRLYGGRLHVATRNPRTEGSDRIEIVHMEGRRDKAGVVRDEVEEVLRRLRVMLADGTRNVGVISPFRAQADALEVAILDAFSMAELDALDLRVGTVHAFQGNERDIVVVSLGIGGEDRATTWRFVENPHLFAVLATRARQHLVLLLSDLPPSGGLMADYVAEADAPPGQPTPAGTPGTWIASVSAGLVAAGIPAVPLYPAGRAAVDVCAGTAAMFLGLECSVHPEGATAHVERHLALRRAGWDLVGAYRSRWAERQGELLVEVANRLRG